MQRTVVTDRLGSVQVCLLVAAGVQLRDPLRGPLAQLIQRTELDRRGWTRLGERGSTWIILPPFSRAFIGQRKPTGWASAMFDPMNRMQSLLAMSCRLLVAAPRPNEAPRPGTDALCHIRAWFSIDTTPRPPAKSFLIM